MSMRRRPSLDSTPGARDERDATFHAEFKGGMSYKEIAVAHGVGVPFVASCIRYHRERNGLTARREQREMAPGICEPDDMSGERCPRCYLRTFGNHPPEVCLPPSATAYANDRREHWADMMPKTPVVDLRSSEGARRARRLP